MTKGNRWKHAAKECREQELQRTNDTKGWQKTRPKHCPEKLQGKLNLYKYLLSKGKVVHLTISAVNTNFVLLHHYLIFT